MSAHPPHWLSDLADAVAEKMHALDVLAPIGCHYYRNRAIDQWEVTLFASRTEIVGGERDGQLTNSRFDLDLRAVLELFEHVAGAHWQTMALGPDDELGAHISIEGTFQGKSVWVRILSHPPTRFDKGRNVHVHGLRIEDVW